VELIALVEELDRSGEWMLDGAATSSHWVAQNLDVELCTAREWLRIGRALRELPMTTVAFEAGLLSFSKVRVLSRVATSVTEEELLDLAHVTPAAQLPLAIARWRSGQETPEQTAERQHAARRTSWRIDLDGMWVGSLRLPPRLGASVAGIIDAEVMRASRRRRRATAVASAAAQSSAGRWPSIPQQRADAFLEVMTGGGAQTITELVFHVRGDGLSFDDGTPVPWDEMGALIPQSFIRALIHDADSNPVNASTRRRFPTTRQKRVVKEVTRGCVDCGAPVLIEYDHVPDYAESGVTDTRQMEARCHRCHHLRHRETGEDTS
jgi:hypothetical protein